MTGPNSDVPLLELRSVGKSYGAFHAVDGVSLTVPVGERHAVIGPNGAGKTTLFNLVAGTLRVSSGRVVFAGRDVTRAGEHRRARAGIGRTFQHSSLFTTQTCAENVLLAVRRSAGVGTSFRVSSKLRANLTAQVEELLERVDLTPRAHDLVANLSHGERRQLEVAMALAGEPSLLLFDEPTAGMSLSESAQFTRLVQALPRTLTVLIIEHDLDVVFTLADRITVLAAGECLEQGMPEQIRTSSQVEAVYLGTGHDEVFIR
ncbi:ABC transporter ATP-binding protein [Pseudonocardia sichuanensis]